MQRQPTSQQTTNWNPNCVCVYSNRPLMSWQSKSVKDLIRNILDTDYTWHYILNTCCVDMKMIMHHGLSFLNTNSPISSNFLGSSYLYEDPTTSWMSGGVRPQLFSRVVFVYICSGTVQCTAYTMYTHQSSPVKQVIQVSFLLCSVWKANKISTVCSVWNANKISTVCSNRRF